MDTAGAAMDFAMGSQDDADLRDAVHQHAVCEFTLPPSFFAFPLLLIFWVLTTIGFSGV
jgi:hypothetical protein